MSYFTPGNRDYDSPFYDEDSAGEIVKLYRHEYERQLRDLQRIDRFLDSLTPADAQLSLFTHAERRLFDIKVHRKRSPCK